MHMRNKRALLDFLLMVVITVITAFFSPLLSSPLLFFLFNFYNIYIKNNTNEREGGREEKKGRKEGRKEGRKKNKNRERKKEISLMFYSPIF